MTLEEPTLRVGVVDGEPAVTLAAGELEATFLPGLGLLGTSLRHRGEDLLALPGGVAGYRDRHVTGLPLLAPWANRLPSWRYRAAGVEVDLEGLDLATDPAGLPIHGTLTGGGGWSGWPPRPAGRCWRRPSTTAPGRSCWRRSRSRTASPWPPPSRGRRSR